jgi:hypothetical protein
MSSVARTGTIEPFTDSGDPHPDPAGPGSHVFQVDLPGGRRCGRFLTWHRICATRGMPWMLITLTLQLGPSCVYLRSMVTGPSPCGQRGGPARRPVVPPVGGRCAAGLPPSVRLRFLPSGSVCAGPDLFERVVFNEDTDARHPADLPEWVAVSRLCLRGHRPVARPRRWWLPRLAVSAERSLRLEPDGLAFVDATTFWVTLSFPLPAGERGSPTDGTGRVHELCDTARRLNHLLLHVHDIRLRTRAGLQMLAWRDELEFLLLF